MRIILGTGSRAARGALPAAGTGCGRSCAGCGRSCAPARGAAPSLGSPVCEAPVSCSMCLLLFDYPAIQETVLHGVHVHDFLTWEKSVESIWRGGDPLYQLVSCSVTGCCIIFSSCNRIYLHRQSSNQQRRCFFFQGQRNTAYSIVWPATVSPAHPVPKHIKKPDYVTTGIVPDWGDDIEIKNEDQIQGLRQACQLARHVLLLAGKGLKVGMTTEEIDSIVHHEIIRQNAYPSPLGYGGFPKSVCTSVNNVVCHGIPDSRPLQDGDIINIDVTVYYNGYHGDTSETFLVGNVDKSGQKLVEVARKCRDEAIAACRPGAPFSVIGNTI
ncbi:PREDICTED: methionine aminopeptidase 1D, mitochondrial, partial [Fulmarus glacialis]|uniref:methionine aminopeptidase 1D, mitochondrial n=1 Tax=Fulmarus glacialis TaxID=30455 RepID=UPI00051C46D1